MKLQKKQNDFTKIISKEFFDGLKLVNNDNIKDLYNSTSSYFLVISVVGKKTTVVRDFYIMSRRVKGMIVFKFYYNNQILQSSINIREEQSLEDYKDESEWFKNMIKDEISKKRLYVKET